jgi:hypothetical protein
MSIERLDATALERFDVSALAFMSQLDDFIALSLLSFTSRQYYT